MAVTNALAGIAVNRLDSAIAWYSKLLGRAPDQRPMPEVAEWRFEKGGWIQVFEDKGRAGLSSVTLVEDDIGHRLSDLEAKGIPVESTTDTPAVRVAIIADEAGNRVVFAQSMTGGNRSTL